MKITHEATIDFAMDWQSYLLPIKLMQGDSHERCIRFHLYSNRNAWEVPKGVHARVSYEKEDSTKGIYNALPDGTPAWSIVGNTVTVLIAPQVMTAPGKVKLAVSLWSGDKMISTFPVTVDVQPLPGFGGTSEDYVNLSGSMGPLSVTENGTYGPGYTAATVEWDENTEYDFSAPLGDMSIRCKKVTQLCVPANIRYFADLAYVVTFKLPDGTEQRVPLSELEMSAVDDAGSGYMSNKLSYAMVWIKDATVFNETVGDTVFEDNTVYVSDFIWAYAPDACAGMALSLTGPGERLDGISSVTVEVTPELQSQSHTITGNGTFVYAPESAYDGISEFEITVNVQPALQEKTVTENGEVTPDAGYDGLSKVTVDVESGMSLNGIIEQYKVNAGATVNAGDFVEFVNKWSSNHVFDDSSNVPYMSACKLGNNSVFIAYRYNSGSTYYLYGQILAIEGTEVVIGAKTLLATVGNEYYFRAISAVALTDSKVFVAYNHYVSGDKYLYGRVLTIDGTTITAGPETVLKTNAQYCEKISAVALTDSKVFVAYAYLDTYVYLCGQVLTIDGTTITAGATLILTSINSSYRNSCFKAISTTALTDGKVFVAYQYYAANFSESQLFYIVCTIDGTTITLGPAGPRVSFSSGLDSFAGISATALTDSKVFVAYRYYTNSAYSYYGMVCTIEGTTVTAGTATMLSSIGDSNAVSAIALTDNKVFVAYSYYGVVCTIEGTAITVGAETALDDARTSTVSNSALSFSDNSVLVVSNGSKNTFIGATIDGMDVTVNSELEGAGTYVQPATGRLHNVGVAATGGAGGETVDVYVVG